MLRKRHGVSSGRLKYGKLLLVALNECSKVIQRDNIDVWERCLSQYIIMAVVGDDISGTGSNSAVHKLVVIRISFNHLEVIVGRDKFYKGAVDDGLHNQLSRFVVCQSLQNSTYSSRMSVETHRMCSPLFSESHTER